MMKKILSPLNMKKNSHTSFATAMRHSLLILILPTCEFLLARIFVRGILGFQWGWSQVTDHDFVFALPIAWMVGISVMESEKPLTLKSNTRWWEANLLLFSSFLLWNSYTEVLTQYSPVLFVTVWGVLALLFLGSAFLVWVPFSEFRSRRCRWVWLPVTFIALSPMISRVVLDEIWPFFAAHSGEGTCRLLNSVLTNVSCLVSSYGEPRLILRHPDLGISIGKGCGGMGVIILYLNLFLVFFMRAREKLSTTAWLLIGASGLTLGIGLNLLRISLFFGGTLFMQKVLGTELATNLMVTLFHVHAGWILYALGFLIFFALVQKLTASHFSLQLPRVLWERATERK